MHADFQKFHCRKIITNTHVAKEQIIKRQGPYAKKLVKAISIVAVTHPTRSEDKFSV